MVGLWWPVQRNREPNLRDFRVPEANRKHDVHPYKTHWMAVSIKVLAPYGLRGTSVYLVVEIGQLQEIGAIEFFFFFFIFSHPAKSDF